MNTIGGVGSKSSVFKGCPHSAFDFYEEHLQHFWHHQEEELGRRKKENCGTTDYKQHEICRFLKGQSVIPSLPQVHVCDCCSEVALTHQLHTLLSLYLLCALCVETVVDVRWLFSQFYFGSLLHTGLCISHSLATQLRVLRVLNCWWWH